MPKITVTSDKYPGAAFALPNSPFFSVGVPYEITEEEKGEILKQYGNYDYSVRQAMTLQFTDSVVPPEVTLAIETPAIEVEVVDASTPVEDLVELSEEDKELIQMEVAKLYGKTSAEAEPFVITTGNNIDFPRILRVEYLKAVMADRKLPRAVKTVAEKTLEQV